MKGHLDETNLLERRRRACRFNKLEIQGVPFLAGHEYH